MEIFQHTGFCPQLKGVWENLTLRQHLEIVLRLKGLRGADLEAAVAAVEVVEALLPIMKLKVELDAFWESFSQGNSGGR